MTFDILGTRVLSSLFNTYDPPAPTRTTVYGPSHFGWNFLSVGLVVFQRLFSRPGLRLGMYAVLPACCTSLSIFAGMTLCSQL